MESPKCRVKSAVARMRDDGVLKVHAFPSWLCYSPAIVCDLDQICLVTSLIALLPRSLDLCDLEHVELARV